MSGDQPTDEKEVRLAKVRAAMEAEGVLKPVRDLQKLARAREAFRRRKLK